MSNRYLTKLKSRNSLYGLSEVDPSDELEVEFIAGEISDIHDEAEILNTPPKADGKELKAAQLDILDRLDEMYQRSKRVKCPMRRKAIQQKILDLKKHGSLNKTYSLPEQIMWSTIVGGSAVLLTAMGYQAYQTRDIKVQAQLMDNQTLVDLQEDGLYAKPTLASLFKQYKKFYAGEFLVIAALYHHKVFGSK